MRSLLLILLVLPCLSYAGSGYLQIPAEKTVEACQARLSIDGRVIAEMRWNLKFDVETAHKQFKPEDLPEWFVEAVRGWIDSAYKAEDPIKWFKGEWENCAGET